MAIDIYKFRKLVALDDSDALSRFGLGQALFQHDGSPAALNEAAEHLLFANAKDPDHLATYHILGQVLIKLARKDEAEAVLERGLTKSADVGEGMGRDLGPAMAKMLESI